MTFKDILIGFGWICVGVGLYLLALALRGQP